MAGIYGNSRCTIAALGSENDDGGCFRDRPAIFGPSLNLLETGRGLQIYHPQSRYFAREYESSGPTAAPLHRRAWVVQERALSPRTLYYGSTGIFWECREADASDTDPMSLPRNPRESECVNKRVLDKLLKPLTGPVSEQQFHASWATLVERYTECVLTIKKDRRHAIQGFIDPVGRKLGLTSVAGLWKEFLHTELLWATPGNACSKRVPQMPTWSWISTDGPVRPFYHPWKVHPDEFAAISKWSWKAEIVNYPTNYRNANGNLSSVLTIKGPLLMVSAYSDIMGMKMLFPYCPARGDTGHETCRAPIQDANLLPPSGDWLADVYLPQNGEDIWLLPIVQNFRYRAGLVIVPKEGDGAAWNEWVRLGVFLHHGNWPYSICSKKKQKEMIVNLV